MKIFLCSASFKRDYGGPAYSVSRLGLALAENGATVGLWAPDGSAETAQFLWTKKSHGPVPRTFNCTLDPALEEFGTADVVHDSGIWLPHNHALARLTNRRRIARVVSTRGMLDPWALSHKRIKKAIAWRLYQRSDLRSADALHVTSDTEVTSVRTRSLDVPVWRIPNGVDLPPNEQVAFQHNSLSPRRAVFLGRLHPVKGLQDLLEAWARVRPTDWELILAGPDEDGHRSQLEASVDQYQLKDGVRFIGQVSGPEKVDLFRCAELFVLPSKSESFGMVVAEALSYGLPVLTTTNVPWPQLEESHCGWRVDPNTTQLSEALARILAQPRRQLYEAGLRGRTLVSDGFGWTAIANEFVKRYEVLLTKRG
ncbi:glycosyl transferase, group 1 [Sulfitobacter sp. JL08]|nr:glycosyl transferase, group 1 [Sulfitobacter sp. JL08]